MSILLQLPDLGKSALAGKDSGLLGCECMDTSTWPFSPEEAVTFVLKKHSFVALKRKIDKQVVDVVFTQPVVANVFDKAVLRMQRI